MIQRAMFDTQTNSSAEFGSDLDKYSKPMHRYRLTRTWDSTKQLLHYVMLNPSVADALADDPTIRKCIGFAKLWGYGGIVVTNLYAFIATDPKVMKSAPDAIGRDNNKFIVESAKQCDLTICAWGNDGKHRGPVVLKLLHENGIVPMAIRLTKEGHPSHPLYLPYKAIPVAM